LNRKSGNRRISQVRQIRQKQNRGRSSLRAGKRGTAPKFTAVMRRKLAWLFVIAVASLVGLTGRIVYINAVSGEQYTKKVLANSQSSYASKNLAYRRGDILDRNGTVLASSEKRYNVILDCRVVNSDKGVDKEPTIKALVNLFGLDEGTIRTLLESDKTKLSQYQVVKKDITIEEKQSYDAYRNGTEDDPLSDEERKERSKIRGIWFEEEYVRNYPLKSLACDVLGFTYGDGQADWGIEGYYNNSLKGIDGRKYGYWGSGSDLEQTIVDPVDGNNVKATLDANIQSVVEKYLKLYQDTYKKGPSSQTEGAKNVGVVVMNPNDGAILAMASSDPYDLNSPRDLSAVYPQKKIEAMSEDQQTEALEQMWKNFCISDAFEPGSVFKPITISAALEDGTLSGNEMFNCDGAEVVSGVTIKCADVDGHGEETLSDLIKNSCNDGLMQVGAKLGVDEFAKYQHLFGFGSRTGIDLSGEAAGITGGADTMEAVDLATASFGQGFTSTMVQEAAAISSIVNGGYYYRPHVVSQIQDKNGATVKSFDKVLMKQTVSNEVSQLVRSYMKASVDEGTSVYSKVDGYSMGGKTGTAQKIPRGNGKYLVSWVGFVPYENPQVVIYTVVDEPNVEHQDDNRYPQWISRDILQEILPYLNVYPDEAPNPGNPHLAMDLTHPNGDAVTDTAADTNVPEPQGTEDETNTEGGNTQETDGYTNDEADLAE
jgi:stage V sporulation protein D (sporulation-specific penicillin-binding protein)